MNGLVPLKRVVAINPETMPEDTPPDFEFEYVDIGSVGRGRLIEDPSRIHFEEAPSRARRVLRPGDTVVSTVRTYLRAVVPIDREGLVGSTGFACLRPATGIEPRFLGWWAQSDDLIEEVVARSVGVSYPAINSSEIGLIKLPVPPLAEQRAIADYLDTETARIDALIAKKKALFQGVNERLRATVSRSLGGDQPWRADALPLLPPAWEWIAARHVFPKVTVGVVVNPSHYFTEAGVPFIHGTDIRDGGIDQGSLKYLSDEDSRGPLAKSRLQAGDVVAMRVGEPGRAAVVPPELEGANCASVIIFKRSELLDPWLVAEFMNSSPGRAQVEMAQYGAAQGVLNVSDALAIRFPVPPLDVQRGLREQLEGARRSARTLIERLSTQIRLLEERRQALVTAVVTGRLKVPGVAS